MTTHSEDEWTLLKPTTPSEISMETTACELPIKADEALQNSTVDTKSTTEDMKDKDECTCEPKPAVSHQDGADSSDEDYARPRRAGRRTLPIRHQYFSPPSPIQIAPPPPPPPMPFPFPSSAIASSTQLLDRVGKDDGVFELPHPAMRKIYLATYPFGDKDVKKWSWLFAAGVEDEYIAAPITEEDVNRSHTRQDGYVHCSSGIEVPSVYLSRALDTEAIPDETKHNLRFFIVTKNRYRPGEFKLLVAESRKAAGMLIYHDILEGDTILFVGAMVHECQSGRPKKYKKVDSLKDAVALYNKGVVGVIC